MTEVPAQTLPCAHRRALLAGLGGLSAAALLAACGDGDATAKAPAATSPAPAQSSAPAKTTVADTAQVPVGGGIVANGVLITQPVSGTFKVFDAACPHKGILVTAPQNGIAVCPAHQSKFSIADGSKIDGPTPTGLKLLKSEVDGTSIVRLPD
ncbi:Rieske (2Fe-2S) protein [Dactylosporangium sp. CA-139114]|uniref:Rieske (2Fe-2S) protein n=1 Tax=Dactylosporangium sp. CA-139114 TaxID=3239931 RepID=UPI003D998B45